MVVDNASKDGSPALVRSRFPQVELVVNTRNVGYGAAANQGVSAAIEADIPYVLVLNPDLVMAERSLAELVQALELHPSVGAANPEIADGAGPHFRRTSCDSATDGIADMQMVDWLGGCSGCALLLRTEPLRHLGGFWPQFFLYCEDTDLLCRLRRAGWAFARVPRARVFHVGQASSRQLLGGARVCYYQVRNQFLWVKRNRWHEGLASCLGTVRWGVSRHVTLRRLLHPTRVLALVAGVIVGLYLLMRTKPVEVPERASVHSDAY
jgi:hypothetical protein